MTTFLSHFQLKKSFKKGDESNGKRLPKSISILNWQTASIDAFLFAGVFDSSFSWLPRILLSHLPFPFDWSMDYSKINVLVVVEAKKWQTTAQMSIWCNNQGNLSYTILPKSLELMSFRCVHRFGAILCHIRFRLFVCRLITLHICNRLVKLTTEWILNKQSKHDHLVKTAI